MQVSTTEWGDKRSTRNCKFCKRDGEFVKCDKGCELFNTKGKRYAFFRIIHAPTLAPICRDCTDFENMG